jgi:hypothetical protein
VKLHGQGWSSILVGHDLDVRASAALRRDFESLIEFSACGDTRREPVVTAKRLGQVGVVPLSKIVVLDVRILAEQPFDQIARIVEHENDGLQPAPAELSDFLGVS